MPPCNFKECSRDAYKLEDKCILHCKKKSSLYDDAFLTEFEEELCSHVEEYAAKYIFKHQLPSNFITLETIRSVLRSIPVLKRVKDNALTVLTKLDVEFEGIDFPKTDYFKILVQLQDLYFYKCKFRAFDESLHKKSGVSYEACEFETVLNINGAHEYSNNYSFLYKNCEFKEDVILKYGGAVQSGITPLSTTFVNCNFKKKLEIDGASLFAMRLLHNESDTETKIGQFIIVNCEFTKKFILNFCEIGSFDVTDSEFKEKFEFKHNTVSDFKIINTNYFELVDTYKTTYTKFRIEKSIFKEFVAFEKCKFGEVGNDEKEYVASFEYATFLTFVNFRTTNFLSGLDIKNINLKEPPNFLGAEITPANSNRETFRIVKNSFDKAGNNIEANKFYVKEMKKRREELKKKPWLNQEKLILFTNHLFSNFGESYVRPIIALFLVLPPIYFSLQYGHQTNILYSIYPPANEIISVISCYANSIAKHLTPFSKSLEPGMEFISLSFYIANSSLIWLTIVAIKRRTKR